MEFLCLRSWPFWRLSRVAIEDSSDNLAPFRIHKKSLDILRQTGFPYRWGCAEVLDPVCSSLRALLQIARLESALASQLHGCSRNQTMPVATLLAIKMRVRWVADQKPPR